MLGSPVTPPHLGCGELASSNLANPTKSTCKLVCQINFLIFIIMKEIIANSNTINEAVIKIYGYDGGNSRRKFFKMIKEAGIDITHLRKRKLKYERVIKQCPVCSKKFEAILNNRPEKITCSYSCSNTYFRSGKFNPNWKDSAYRTTCFEEHKKECVICGEDKIVAVHHFDENRNNNSVENLIPLCPTHHQYVHSSYKHLVIDKIVKYRQQFLS